VLYVGLAYLWQIDEGPKFEMSRHNGAKFVYIGSFITLLMEVYCIKLLNYSVSQFTTRACFVLAKAMLVLSGHNFQMVIFLCLAQHLATRAFLQRLRIKPSLLALSIIFVLTMTQYFFRAGVRNKFASIRFGSVFMGFINYNYFLHGFLTLLTTYYSQVICFLLLPLYLSSVEKNYKVVSLPFRYAGPLLVKLLFLECLIISWFSSLEASLERTSLLFPERIAPACLFNLC